MQLNKKHLLFGGPPGTGKTTTMGALATTLVQNNHRVLLVAQSNNAVDQLLFATYVRLSLTGQQYAIARLGNEVDKKCYGFTKKSFSTGDFLAKRVGNGFNWKKHVIESSIVAANIAALSSQSYDFIGMFDYVLVDEVSMSNVPSLMVPSFFSNRSVVFGGDPCQLSPPFPDDMEEPNEWFSKNIFEKASVVDYFDKRVSFLDTQYRMQREIGELISQTFYDGQLKLGVSSALESDETISKIFFINSSGSLKTRLSELNLIDDQLRHNDTHATIASKAIEIGLKKGFSPSDIGIIAPYNAQIAKIKGLIDEMAVEGRITSMQADDIKVSTIHSFQGQEKRMIIVDITDSNVQPTPLTAKGNLINVALSRAKDLLFIIGNKDYLLNKRYFNTKEIDVFSKILNHSEIVSEDAFYKIWI